jgi:hypothetical protein
MAITQILALGNLLALIGALSLAPGYAAEPCCGWVGGKYINLRTGMAVLPPKDARTRSGSVETAKPQPDDVIIVIGPVPEPKRATDK